MRSREELKDPKLEARLFASRAGVALMLVVLGFLILFARLFDLQIVMHHNFATLSDRNRISVRPLAPVRGLIFDRNGVLLADNRSVFSLEIIPEKVPDLERTLSELKSMFGLDDDTLEDFRSQLKRARHFERIPLITRLSEEQRARFEVNRYRFPGVSVEGRLVRHYPYGSLFVHVIGYVGRINDQEADSLDAENYRGTHHVGKLGLEKYYEKLLHGRVGYSEVETNALGRVIRVLRNQPSEPGADLHLALDYRLQREADKALGDHRGAVVAIDPQSGEVLALVSKPGYDPNPFVTGISSAAYRKLLASQDRPLFNRALRGQYPPGSTIKPMLGLAGLETGVISPGFTIQDNGWFELPGEDRRYRDWNWKQGGHGKVNLRKAITHSCDTYFYALAVKLGIDRIHEQMRRFGFGETTGIDMHEEVTALLPSREWKRSTRRQPWFPGETVIVGIGQGFWTTTPIQLANATAILANRGTHFRTRVVHAIGKGQQMRELEPQLFEEQPTASMQHMETIRRAMREVNTSGTGARAFRRAPFTSAGKTGTAQLISIGEEEEYVAENIDSRLRDNAMYVGFAPYDHPTIAVAVVVENQGHGGSVAAPVARDVMQAWLSMTGQIKSAGKGH